MKYILLILAALIVGFFSSCDTEGTGRMPSVTGRPGEAVLVINDPIWETEGGEKLNELFRQPQPALPQVEPMFNLARIEHEAFKSVFRSHRNVVMVNVSPRYEETRMVVRRNVWARPQLVIEINTMDSQSLYSFVEKYEDRILDHLFKAERERHIQSFERYKKREISDRLSRNHNLSLSVPPGFRMDVDTTNFAWIAKHEVTPKEKIKGVFVYHYERDNPKLEDLTADYLIERRNEFLKSYVPGPRPDTWMTTEMRYYQPHFKTFEHEGREFAEIRGLWRVENHFMGGPFVSLTTIDEERDRVVTVEAFVFSPETDKRDLIREMEAVLYTLELETDENGL